MRMAYLCALLALCGALGCASSPKTRTLLPPEPEGGDAAAKARFSELRRQFEQDGHVAPAEFEVVAREFPEDPVAPYALLYAAKSARQAGDVEAVQRALDGLVHDYPNAPAALLQKTRIEVGLTLTSAGQWAEALAFLEGGEPYVETEEERITWLKATCAAAGAQGLAIAWPWYFKVWEQQKRLRDACGPFELQAVIETASPAALQQAWAMRQAAPWPGISLVGRRLLATAPWPLEESADAVRKAIAANDRALGLGTDAPPLPLRLGEVAALIPQSGNSVRVGEALERMLAVAGGGPADRLTLIDSAGARSPDVASLKIQGIKAVVGPVDADAHVVWGPKLAAEGMPSISLSLVPDEARAAASQFFIVHAATARAKTLARYAKAHSVTSIAVLSANSGYGKAVSAAFLAEAKRLGLRATSFSYDARATNFGGVVAKIAKGTQGVFVADTAQRLELIAPALAAAGHKASPAGQKGGFVLLATAEGMGPELLARAGRYLLGAVFAPGFTPAALDDDQAAAILRQYRDATGKWPTALEAYAYDAVSLLRAVGGDVEAIRGAQVVGLTGTIRFDDEHRRADDGVMYTVRDNSETATREVVRLVVASPTN